MKRKDYGYDDPREYKNADNRKYNHNHRNDRKHKELSKWK